MFAPSWLGGQVVILFCIYISVQIKINTYFQSGKRKRISWTDWFTYHNAQPPSRFVHIAMTVSPTLYFAGHIIDCSLARGFLTVRKQKTSSCGFINHSATSFGRSVMVSDQTRIFSWARRGFRIWFTFSFSSFSFWLNHVLNDPDNFNLAREIWSKHPSSVTPERVLSDTHRQLNKRTRKKIVWSKQQSKLDNKRYLAKMMLFHNYPN